MDSDMASPEEKPGSPAAQSKNSGGAARDGEDETTDGVKRGVTMRSDERGMTMWMEYQMEGGNDRWSDERWNDKLRNDRWSDKV